MNALRQAKLSCSGNQNLMLLGVKANGAIKGRLLAMSLQQRFRNPTDRNSEITYTFPLPWGAVLMGVDVELNGKQLTGAVTAKNTARAKYEEALSEGNTSIMLELNPDQSYTLELGNLMAREECSITVRYAQVLQVEHGQIRLMLPTTIAPRYGNPVLQGGLQPHQVTVTDLAAEYPFDISVTLYGDLAKANVASPSHTTGYFPLGEDLVVRLAQRGALDRDFILTVSNLQNQSAAISCEDKFVPEQTAVMVNFSPKFSEISQNPVSVKILVDCSGSMGGDSIESARRALRSIVSGFNSTDKFSLSRFGDEVEHRSRGMWSGAAPAKASAQRWVDGVNADLGGTEMASALKSTISIVHKGKSDILLITDGEISGIDTVIDTAKRSAHRVFVVGIGASPAEAHLRRLASATGGVCDFVAPGEDVEPAVLRMFHRLRAPCLKNLRVEWPSAMNLRWSQRVTNQVFENDALNICAFFDTASSDTSPFEVKLWGRVDDSPSELLLAYAGVEKVESTVNTLARVAAYAQYSEHPAERVSLAEFVEISEAQKLAVLYQLVTKETNFILVHERTEAEKALEMPDGHTVPQMLAAGWGGTGTVSHSKKNLQVYRCASGFDDMPDDRVHDMPFGASVSRSLAGAALGNSAFIGHAVGMATPSVWRTRDRSAAAAKIDALCSGGMNDFEIPAFLRKQSGGETVQRATGRSSVNKLNVAFWSGAVSADKNNVKHLTPVSYIGITPAGIDEWLRINNQSLWPTTYGELRDMGLGVAICEWLELEVGADSHEEIVVSTFLAVLREFHFIKIDGLKKTVNAIREAVSPQRTIPVDVELAESIREGLRGILPVKWPNRLVNFPENAIA